jgi:hypothetical protein
MPSAAIKLLDSIVPDRRDSVRDYVEYWDSIKKAKKDVGPGFLYDLIKNGDPLPSSFETKKQRDERLTAEDRKRKLAQAEESLRSGYEEHCRRVVDRFIAEELPLGEFDGRVAEYKAEMLAQPGIWSDRPDMAEQFARNAVRAEFSKRASLPSYEDFRQKELPGILSNLQIDSAINVQDAVTTAPNAVYEPPDGVPSMNAVLPISDQNSSLGAM